MGKLYDSLKAQLKTDFKKDAEECIRVYNELKEIYNGHVWSSTWNSLVNTKFIGDYPYIKIFKLNEIGKMFLKGITKI